MKKWLTEFVQKMNESGVPLPMVRVEGKPSLTATFTFLSFNTAILGQIGKVTNLIGEIDLTSANYLFFGCLACYTGRRMTAGKKITLSEKDKDDK